MVAGRRFTNVRVLDILNVGTASGFASVVFKSVEVLFGLNL